MGNDRVDYNEIAITLDLDWAPDFMIAEVAALLRDVGVRATWFVTHESPEVTKLRSNPELFELGIHPNFLPGSTHGSSVEEILAHCTGLVPDAVSYRSHSIYQSGRLYAAILKQTPLRVDANTFLPEWSHIKPIKHVLTEGILTRLPFFWIDDYEMCKESPLWTYARFRDQPGLQVFAFHPLHIYLNSNNLQTYEALKTGMGPLSKEEEKDFLKFRQGGEGDMTMFEDVLRQAAENGGGRLMKEFI